MPLEKSPAELQEDENEGMPLLAYTFSAGNGMTTGASQLLLQNNLTDDTMYLQGFEDGTTGWMLDGLPVLFSSDGQPIFLNQTSTDQPEICSTENNIDVITNENKTRKEEEYLETNEMEEPLMQDQMYSTEGITTMPNNMNLITTVLTSNADLNTLGVPSKSYININGLYIPIQQKDTCDKTQPQNEADNQEITGDEQVQNDEDLTETTGDTNSITLSTEISELADVITAYKCKRCDYTCSDKQLFLNHYTDSHLEQYLNGDKIELVLEENEDVQEPNQYNTIVVSTDQDDTGTELIQTPDFTVPKYLIETSEGTIEISAQDLQQMGLSTIETCEDPVITSTVDDNDVETIEEKYILVCSQCSKGFDSIEECKQHMINDHKLKELNGRSDKSKIHTEQNLSVNQSTLKNNVVNSQNETITTDETLLNDSSGIESGENKTSDPQALFNKTFLKSRKANGPLPFKCQIRGCSYRFATEEVREQHTKCHTKVENGSGNIIAYKCSQCDMPQKNWRTTSLHLWRQHGIQTDLITCPICNSFKATASQLEHHMLTHSDKKTYCCSQCGKFYRQASQLRNHRIIHLDKTSDKRPFWFREKECSQCHKTFSNSKSLKKHFQSVHSKLKPFICNVCGHSCARKAMLQMHLRQHTGEKPYACEFCNYRTGDHNSLRRHNMKHSGVRPYKCPHCPYTSIQSSAYKYHISNKHPGESGIYTCSLCPFKSVSQDVYTNHMNDHELGVIPTTKTAMKTTPTNIVTTEAKDQNNGTNTIYFYSSDVSQKASAEPTTQIISNERKSSVSSDNEEPCYLRFELLGEEPSVDTGGITIPAEPECSSLLQMALLT